MKKKLDFYLATGNLPPVAKSNPQNGPKDTNRPASTKKPLVSSTKELDSTAHTSVNTVVHKVEEDEKNQSECPCPPCNFVGADSEGVEAKPESSNLDHSNNNSELVLKRKNYVDNRDSEVENCVMTSGPVSQICVMNSEPCFNNDGFDSKVNEDKVPGTPLRHKLSTVGSLYYEPSRLESFVPQDSDPSNMHGAQWDYNSSTSPFASPTSFFTPPCVKSNGSSLPSPESVLKMAALSFPNTPSILRKRKSKAQTPLLPNKTEKAERASEGDRVQDSKKQCGIKTSLERPGSQDGSLSESPPCHSSDTNSISFNGNKAFNASPPYRLRSKRTAVFKSVEKQLAFTCDNELEGNIKSIEVPSQETSSPVAEDSRVRKMGVT